MVEAMADILIKCMEMPKNCSRCQFCFGANNICPWTREYATSTKRHPDCPLIEIPEHGRLIDADKLEVNFGWLAEAEGYKTHISFVYSNAIDNAPTVIPSSENY